MKKRKMYIIFAATGILSFAICILIFLFSDELQSIFTKKSDENPPEYIIGYLNYSNANSVSYDRMQAFCDIAEENNWDVMSVDADRNDSIALAYIESFVERKVDLLVLHYPDEAFAQKIVQLVQEKGIPLIMLDNKIENVMYYGMDTQQAGKDAGQALSGAMKKLGGADFLIVIGNENNTASQKEMLTGAKEAFIKEVSVDEAWIAEIDGETLQINAKDKVIQLLNDCYDREKIAVIALTDDYAAGAIEAMEAMREKGFSGKGSVVSFHGGRLMQTGLIEDETLWKASIGNTPKQYAKGLVKMVSRVFKSENTVDDEFVSTVVYTKDNVDDGFTKFNK